MWCLEMGIEFTCSTDVAREVDTSQLVWDSKFLSQIKEKLNMLKQFQ